jgi:hypothetical protein
MGRTLTDLINTICLDIDEDNTDSLVVSKLTSFVNRGYKELAKKDLIETSSDVVVTDYTIAKPSDYFKVSKILYNDLPIKWSDEESNILVDWNGNMTLFYYRIPLDLTGSSAPVTQQENDEVIIQYAKYLYWQSENKYDKAEAHRRDYQELLYKVKPRKRTLQFTVER